MPPPSGHPQSVFPDRWCLRWRFPVQTHGPQIPGNHHHGIGRHHIASQMAHNHGIEGKGHAPGHIVSESRHGVTDIIPKQYRISRRTTFRIRKCTRPSLRLSRRQTLVSIPRAITVASAAPAAPIRGIPKRPKINTALRKMLRISAEPNTVHGEYHPLYTPHDAQIHLGNSHEQIGNPHDSQVIAAYGDQRSVIGENPHQKLRKSAGQQGQTARMRPRKSAWQFP